ncbi:hypothetical protein B0H14DRAFT_2624281 [Mycena olivaceomarginata]|nr:hypothetical protein B0H14DRAFT_2624281 [Mycena olivaceomarginata]
MQHTGAKPAIYDTLSSTQYLRSQPPTQLADIVAAVTAIPTPLGSPWTSTNESGNTPLPAFARSTGSQVLSNLLVDSVDSPTTVAFSSRHVAFSALAHNGWLIFALSRCSGFFTWGNFTQHLTLSVIFTSEMFNPVIKIHGRHISSVLQSFTIQMVLTVDICFTYSTDDLSNFHQISLDSQPGSNKPTAGRLVSELSRMVEDLFSPDARRRHKVPNIRREKENGTRSWYKLDRRRARQINDGTKEPACRKHQPGFLNRGWFSPGVSSLGIDWRSANMKLPPGYAPAASPARPWARAGARSDGGGKKALMQISWVPASATEHWSARWECAGFSEKLTLVRTEPTITAQTSILGIHITVSTLQEIVAGSLATVKDVVV